MADIQTVVKAKEHQPQRPWLGVGVLPPHVANRDEGYRQTYSQTLMAAGANVVIDSGARFDARLYRVTAVCMTPAASFNPCSIRVSQPCQGGPKGKDSYSIKLAESLIMCRVCPGLRPTRR